MAAYSPLSRRIFGALTIGIWPKLLFLESLVLSTLLFNAHVRVLDHRALAALNSVYMRSLRRIADETRFSKHDNISDVHVRMKLGQPSIDCLLVRARLLYLSRMLRSKNSFLIAVLATRDSKGNLMMPWTLQAISDLHVLFDHSVQARAAMCANRRRWQSR